MSNLKVEKYIVIIAGEVSGDNLGASLMSQLIEKNKNITFRGVGGPKMRALGLKSIISFEDIAITGITEIIPKIPLLLRHLSTLKNNIINHQTDLLITIDSPDFNFRLARKVCGNNFPIIHYVAPSVWAWRPGRAKKISILFDHLFTLYPFENFYFEKVGLRSTYVGNPIVFNWVNGDGLNFRQKYLIESNDKVILLLPGSRSNEIKTLMPVFLQTIYEIINYYDDGLKVFCLVPDYLKSKCEEIILNHSVFLSKKITFVSSEEKQNLFAASNLAIAASGTVNLELALEKVPTIVTYKLNYITYFIAKLLIKTKWISIVNIIFQDDIYSEFIQSKCNSKALSKEIKSMFASPIFFKNKINELKKIDSLFFNKHSSNEFAARNIVLKYLEE
ncbi:lipid-A-disaccharide synthase [Alphaproteobacteria bacterium]|nr:lipid-A-disaccharide synthase [Alphaproteobacteria bacterium]